MNDLLNLCYFHNEFRPKMECFCYVPIQVLSSMREIDVLPLDPWMNIFDTDLFLTCILPAIRSVCYYCNTERCCLTLAVASLCTAF